MHDGCGIDALANSACVQLAAVQQVSLNVRRLVVALVLQTGTRAEVGNDARGTHLCKEECRRNDSRCLMENEATISEVVFGQNESV